MARPSPRPPIARLRKIFLGALLLLVGSLVALFLFGRAGREGMPRIEPRTSPEPTTAPQRDITTIGEGFEYTLTEADRPVFHIRGQSVQVDREDNVYLEKVHLTLYGQGGEPYTIGSDRAIYNRGTDEAVLEGSVHLQGGEGLELTAAGLELKNRGQLVVSRGPVAFRFRDTYAGTSDRLRVQIQERVYLLTGQVKIDSVPGAPVPAALRADRLLFERKRQLVRAEGKVTLRRGDDEVDAERINAFLTDDLKAVRFIRARWDVRGSRVLAGAAGPARLSFSGRGLSILMRPGGEELGGVEGAERAELEGSSGERATLRSEDAAGRVDTATADFFTAQLAGGGFEQVEGFGRPTVVSTVGSQEVRQISGDRMHADVAASGDFRSVELTGKVEYRDTQNRLEAERARFDLTTGQGEATGEEVVVTGERGRLTAPRVRIDRAAGLVHADGGVQAWVEDRNGDLLPGAPEEDADPRVRVTSQEAFWRRSPSSFLFRGDVRAWRGDSVLLARELRGDEDTGKLTASGTVKSLWRPSAEAGSTAPGLTAGGGPIQVTAGKLVYDRTGQTAEYSSDVHAEQDRRTLACDDLNVQLGEDGRARQMTCRGKVQLKDATTGNKVAGDQAVYRIAEGTIEVTGEPATMHDAEGKKVQAGRVTYDLKAGKVRASGSASPGGGG